MDTPNGKRNLFMFVFIPMHFFAGCLAGILSLETIPRIVVCGTPHPHPPSTSNIICGHIAFVLFSPLATFFAHVADVTDVDAIFWCLPGIALLNSYLWGEGVWWLWKR